MLSVDITGAKGALVNVVGGTDMTLAEAEHVVEVVSQGLDPKANIIWGAQIEKELEGIIKVLLVITGVRSKQIIGNRPMGLQETTPDLKDELGIDFLD